MYYYAWLVFIGSVILTIGSSVIRYNRSRNIHIDITVFIYAPIMGRILGFW